MAQSCLANYHQLLPVNMNKIKLLAV